MKIERCIYCGTEQNLTDSDIIPDALTAGRIINKCVCKVAHNSEMTKKFESEVANQLAFLCNHLNIKSKKSTHFPMYEADYEIAGTRYHDGKVIKSHDFINQKIIWDKDKKSAFGPIETIEKIAKSKKIESSEVTIIDINEEMIDTHIPLKYEVFFSEAMHRQVAKIAYEWYCKYNTIQDRYEDFNEIVDYILDGSNDEVVMMVTDKELLEVFSTFCHDGSHAMFAYLDKDFGVSVLVDMFGVAVYNVKVCRHVPKFCEMNCILQKINIDGSGNKECECMCLKDYNEVVEDMITKGIKGAEMLPATSIAGIRLQPVIPQGTNLTHYNLFVLEIMRFLQVGIKGIHSGNQSSIDFAIEQLNKLFNADTIHKRGMKRFVDDNITHEEIRINHDFIGDREILYYYILFKLGESNLTEINDAIFQEFIIGLFHTKEISSRKENMQKKLEEILSCEKYSEVIKNGAEKIRNWY